MPVYSLRHFRAIGSGLNEFLTCVEQRRVLLSTDTMTACFREVKESQAQAVEWDVLDRKILAGLSSSASMACSALSKDQKSRGYIFD